MANTDKEKKKITSYFTHANLIFLMLGIIGTLLFWQVCYNFEIFSAWFSKNILNGNEFRKYAIFFLSIVTMSLIGRVSLQKKYPELNKSLNVIASVFCVLAIFATCVLLSDAGQNYQTSLTVLISSIVLGTGWWIQSLVTASSARKSHTINTIMNQRHSSHYFSKLDNVFNTFGIKNTINQEIAQEYCYGHMSGRKIKDELIQGCRDAAYVLSYYEFISAGIIRKDFDEHLIKECFLEPMKAFEKRTYYLVHTFRNEGGERTEAFENLIILLDMWLPEKSLTTRKNENLNTPLPENAFDNTNDLYIIETQKV